MRTITSAFPWTQAKWRSKEEQRIQTLDLALKILVPLILSACLVVSLKVGSFNGYLQLLSRQSFGSPLMALGACFTLAYLAFQLVRTVLWWRYKSFPLPPGPLPRVTVIIPAYNEGAMVEKSIYAAVASDYPADRLEIICIDDGSKDDTWAYMDRARRRYEAAPEIRADSSSVGSIRSSAPETWMKTNGKRYMLSTAMIPPRV